MQVVYAKEPFPDRWSRALFLAGPTPRSRRPVPSWRPSALEILDSLGYDGVVFVPEDRSGQFSGSYHDQVAWEAQGLALSDAIVFWVPRDLATMPAFTTNVEFGLWVRSGRAVYGRPEGAPKNRYLDWLLGEATSGRERPHATLEATLAAALARASPPALRVGGERYVPLSVWHTRSFGAWYDALRAAGNRLDGAEVLLAHRPARSGRVFAWVLRPKVWIAAEGRHKGGEFVVGRTDLSAVVLHEAPRGETLADRLACRVVLVREFRVAVRNGAGLVVEVPSGSASDPGLEPRAVAAAEVEEETSLWIAPERLRPLESRQLAATLCAHHAHAYAAQLTPEEMDQAEALATLGLVRGEHSERTTLEVRTLGEILADPRPDWSVVGMIASAILTA